MYYICAIKNGIIKVNKKMLHIKEIPVSRMRTGLFPEFGRGQYISQGIICREEPQILYG